MRRMASPPSTRRLPAVVFLHAAGATTPARSPRARRSLRVCERQVAFEKHLLLRPCGTPGYPTVIALLPVSRFADPVLYTRGGRIPREGASHVRGRIPSVRGVRIKTGQREPRMPGTFREKYQASFFSRTAAAVVVAG